MDPLRLKRAAFKIIDQSYTPGKSTRQWIGEQRQLMRIIEDLERQPGLNAHAIKEHILARCNDSCEWARKHLLHPSLQVDTTRKDLENAMHRLSEILKVYDTKILDVIVMRRDRAQERSLSSLGTRTHDFRHIDYSFMSVPREDFKHVREALPHQTYQAKRYVLQPEAAKVATAQWNLELIGASSAWDTTRGGGVKVGVVDTGCDYDHPEIAHCFTEERGYNFVDDNDDPMDDNDHGTHVAGTIAGIQTGVAPDVTLYALKFLDGWGSGSEIGFIQAAEWAIDNGLHVLNGSFGSGGSSPAEEAICDELRARGIHLAAAAGNNGSSMYEYPASYPSVLSVAAVDKHKGHAHFSQTNDQVGISAPGVDVYSCVPGGGYRTMSGTSMATPHAAGGLALLVSTSHQDPRGGLEQSAEHLGSKKKFGHGLLRADQAVMSAGRRRR